MDTQEMNEKYVGRQDMANVTTVVTCADWRCKTSEELVIGEFDEGQGHESTQQKRHLFSERDSTRRTWRCPQCGGVAAA